MKSNKTTARKTTARKTTAKRIEKTDTLFLPLCASADIGGTLIQQTTTATFRFDIGFTVAFRTSAIRFGGYKTSTREQCIELLNKIAAQHGQAKPIDKGTPVFVVDSKYKRSIYKLGGKVASKSAGVSIFTLHANGTLSYIDGGKRVFVPAAYVQEYLSTEPVKA